MVNSELFDWINILFQKKASHLTSTFKRQTNKCQIQLEKCITVGKVVIFPIQDNKQFFCFSADGVGMRVQGRSIIISRPRHFKELHTVVWNPEGLAKKWEWKFFHGKEA